MGVGPLYIVKCNCVYFVFFWPNKNIHYHYQKFTILRFIFTVFLIFYKFMLKVHLKEVIKVIIETLQDVFRFIRSSGKDTYTYLLNK